MPCTSHHSLHCWKLPSRIRTPLSTCLDATVDIVEIDEGTEVKARTDGRRTRIGGTEVPGPGPRSRVAHERIVPLGRVVVEHSIGDGVTVIGAATHRYDPFAVVETLHAGRGAADQFTGTNVEVIVQNFAVAVAIRKSRNAQRRNNGNGADHGEQNLQLFHTLIPPFC